SMSFFFQAEDGIRDDLVTGVQTCALPICVFIRRTLSKASPLSCRSARRCLNERYPQITQISHMEKGIRSKGKEMSLDSASFNHRSEERRVGKECSCRW